MFPELNNQIKKYRVSKAEIARRAGVSRTLVHLVVTGERADLNGIVTIALDMVEVAEQQERKNRERLDALLASNAA